MKNLAIAFCSFRPSQYPTKIQDYREREYLTCLKQLYRVIPDSYDIVIVDNTVSSTSKLSNKELEKFLLSNHFISLDTNKGEDNKGIGELDMLIDVMSRLDIEAYTNITYITARRIFTCPYFFERTEQLAKEALISNPDFLYLNGNFHESHKQGMYNDMIFSMSRNTMQKYAEYSKDRLEKLALHQIGSEQNLYNFIHENNISYEYVKWIGLIRNDWVADNSEQNIMNFHIN